MAQIAELLADSACRLLTVMGPGGIGKTRLAIEAAREQLEHFAHGMWFVPLASLDSVDLLASTIMEALDVPHYGGTDPRLQLLNTLRDRNLLLILDNFEHLLEGTPLVTEMLGEAPPLKLLVTSRERLSLREEWLMPLEGMQVPGKGEVASASEEDYSALQLFVQCARRVRHDFSLASAEPGSVARICQLVDGMPLAIELAAPWIQVMPCQDIVREIEGNLGFLATTLRDMPPRHHSMQAVFDRSWELLLDEERSVVRKLSVFRGGFHREAAEAVTGASLPLLTALVGKSWLRTTPSGRYDVHELIRQYAAERLEGNPVEANQVRDHHSHYFAVFLQEQEPRLRGWEQKEALEEISEDVDNVRVAWDWAVQQGNTEALGRSVDSLWIVSERRGAYRETEQQFARASAKLRKQLAETRSEGSLLQSEEMAIVLAQILCWQAQHWSRLESLERAMALGEESLALVCDGTPNPRRRRALANTQVWLGAWLFASGRDRSRSSRLLRKGLAGAIELGDKRIELTAEWFLGNGERNRGRYAEAEEHLRRSVVLADQTGDAWTKSWCLSNLGWALEAQGDYEAAEEGLHISQTIGDRVGVASSLLDLAGIVTVLEKYEKAGRLYQDALVLADELGLPGMQATCYEGQATIASALGNHAEAEELFETCLVLATEAGEPWRSSLALIGLGHAALALGDAQRSDKRFREALGGAVDAGYVPLALNALVGLAHLLSTENQPQRGVEFLSLSLQHPATWQRTKDTAYSLLSELQLRMSPEAFNAATARGKARELDEVAAEILESRY